MVDKPETRKTHVYRYIGKTIDESGRVVDVPDAYLDFERIDILVTETGAGFDFQRTATELHWYKKETGDSGPRREPNPARRTGKLKVFLADDDPQNPSLWWEVDVADEIVIRDDDQRIIRGFRNKEVWRQRAIRRVTHYDTPFDGDPLYEKGGVLKNYQKIKDSEDQDQFLDIAIPRLFTIRDFDQKFTTQLENRYLVEQTRAPKIAYNADDLNPPWQFDPLQCLVNVNYPGVVEFQDNSDIELSTDVPDTKRGLLVIWFRVPQKSVDAAKKEYQDWIDHGDGPLPKLLGVVPIHTWGVTSKRRKYEFRQHAIGTFPRQCDRILTNGHAFHDSTTDHPAFAWTAGDWFLTGETAEDIDPSYIGIDCTGAEPRLSINIRMPNGNLAEFEGSSPRTISASVAEDRIGFNLDFSTDGSWPHEPDTHPAHVGLFPLVPAFTITTSYDQTGTNAPVVLGSFPETFRTLPVRLVGDGLKGAFDLSEVNGEYSDGQVVETNHWHCLALSYDFTKECNTKGTTGGRRDPAVPPRTQGSRTTSAPRIFVMFDDVNLTGKKLSAYYPDGYADKNAVLSVNGFYVASEPTFTVTDVSNDDFGNTVTVTTNQALPIYRFKPNPIALDKAKFGFPATDAHRSAIKRVELGECQFYTDTVMDFASLEARRAIVTEAGKPTGMRKLADRVGKDPEVKLQGSGNWKRGRNTGTLAIKPPNGPKDGTAVGTIKAYTPNPSLRGPQGRPE
ncbi:hypothetical protein FFI89_018725 [Bradyrhizobium sp. KBS0727]|uniref:hypothetical protein n=1 Tax=unclassified Bradyrhizobium TaxID=2631580 RepID=UPI00110DB00A|nr:MULTISPECIES: hypothetical protein [unclassified Bradyrhizobium]QDW39000.1 hypothetical protein FFI71_018725 [Bradyrhizobium sp. KBS0725]QDW45603.1 hypothetical protein FFI89_018725 [Bradyrhizobium sp. KBS0727]